MEKILEELEGVRGEMEKLKEECRAKTDLSECLKKAHNEQLVRFQEARLQIEKLTQELNGKCQEISEVRLLCEDLKSSLDNKELFLQQLSSANNKLRLDYGEKIRKLEGDNKGLLLALDEASAKIQDLERKVCASNGEIEGLKRLLSIREKRCLEAEQSTQASKELKKREDMILDLEQENRNAQNQLKWRNEQFEHLEEAHLRLQNQFLSAKAEREIEKSALLEEICSLQTSLDSQTRISESLREQLRICHQSLAHEESRRKVLEVEVSEFRSRFDNVLLECQEAKLNLECLSSKRDQEIADLRNLLGEKDAVSKEMGYKTARLEQENQDLRRSLEELKAAQMKKAGSSCSCKELQNKLQSLELLHGRCSLNLKEREVALNTEVKKLTEDMNGLASALKGKNKQIQELQQELEVCQSSIEVQKEETSLLLMVLKSEFSAVYSDLVQREGQMQLYDKEREEKIVHLSEQLEIKDSALNDLHTNIELGSKEVALLKQRIQSLELIEEQKIFAEEELERHKKLLDESSECQWHLKEEVLRMQTAIRERTTDANDALGKAKSELAKKTCEVIQKDFELLEWKSTAANLKIRLQENEEASEQDNQRLLGIVKGQDEKIGDMQQQIVLLESKIAEKIDEVEALTLEKEYLRLVAEDKYRCMERTFEEEKQSFFKITEERDQKVESLLARIKSLEQDFEKAAILSAKMQIEIDVLTAALEKAENLKKLEIEDKNKKILKLEMEVNDSRQKLEFLEECFSQSRQQAQQLESLLQAKHQETEALKDRFCDDQKQLKGILKEMECEREALFGDVTKLLSERKDLLSEIDVLSDQVGEFTRKDDELMLMLEKILKIHENGPAKKLEANGESYASSCKIVNLPFSPPVKGNKDHH